MGSPNERFIYGVSYRRPQGVEGVIDYGKRVASRFIGFQQQHNFHEKMIASGTDAWPIIAGVRRFGSWGTSLLFPLSQGLKQTAVADIPLLGGLARTAGFFVDVGLLPLRIFPHNWAAYHGLIAAGVEVLPSSKNYPYSVDKTAAPNRRGYMAPIAPQMPILPAMPPSPTGVGP